MRLAGKGALVSGAARGIGAAIARLFAAAGAKVLIGDILEAEGQYGLLYLASDEASY